MSTVQSIGTLAQDLTWGAIGIGQQAVEGGQQIASSWAAPIEHSIKPFTTPVADYGWTATAFSTGAVFFGTSFGLNRTVNAIDHWRQGEVKEAVVDSLLGVGALGLAAFEVTVLSQRFFGGAEGEGGTDEADTTPIDGVQN